MTLARWAALEATAWLATACACPPPAAEPQPPPRPPVASPPIGRARAGAPRCPTGTAERFAVAARWPRLDPGPYLDEERTDHGPPTRADRTRAATPPKVGIHLCGAWEGVDGAEMVACRAPDGRFHGPIEMIASDGSVVLQGWCKHGAPLGLWLSWRAGVLVRIDSFTQQPSRGLQLYDPIHGSELYNGVPVAPAPPPRTTP